MTQISVPSPAAAVAEKDDQPQKLGQSRGGGGDVGQSGGLKGLLCAGLLVFRQ